MWLSDRVRGGILGAKRLSIDLEDERYWSVYLTLASLEHMRLELLHTKVLRGNDKWSQH